MLQMQGLLVAIMKTYAINNGNDGNPDGYGNDGDPDDDVFDRRQVQIVDDREEPRAKSGCCATK